MVFLSKKNLVVTLYIKVLKGVDFFWEKEDSSKNKLFFHFDSLELFHGGLEVLLEKKGCQGNCFQDIYCIFSV